MPVSPAGGPLVPTVVPAVPLAPTLPLRARFEALIDELHRLRGEMNRAVHRCGTILRELATDEMLAFAEVTEFGELLEKYDLPSRMYAMKYMTVAQHFTEEEAARLGVERSYAIIRGAAALPSPVAPRALLARNPTIRVGPAAMKLDAAPLRALNLWIGGLAPAETSVDVLRAARAADSERDKLQRRFAAVGLGSPVMQVRRQRGGEYVVRLVLKMSESAALRAAVRKAP